MKREKKSFSGLVEYFFFLILRINLLIPILTLAGLYFWSFVWLKYLEGADSVFQNPLETFYWFMVTITTVGYGDMSPTTILGKYLVTIPVIIIGIGAGAIVLANIFSIFLEYLRRKNMGKIKLNVENHIVVIGYHEGRTEKLIKELKKNDHGQRIILCASADQAEENPIIGVDFSKGQLTSTDTMERANIGSADIVAIDAHDDNEAFRIANLIRNLVKRDAHIVVALHDMSEGKEQIKLLNDRIECAPAEVVGMVAQAIQDPGTSNYYLELVTNDKTNDEINRFNIPEGAGGWSFSELLVYLHKKYGAILMDALESHSPTAPIVRDCKTVKGGMAFFYKSRNRINNFVFPPSSV